MGKLKKISNTSWRQFFNGNKKNYSAIKSQNEVATFCGLMDRTKRKLNIKFEDKFNINVTDIFTITSGLEILLPKAFRDRIGNIILNNPDSFFTVTVLDLVQKPLLSKDEKEQEVIQKYLRKKSRAEIIKELLNLKDTDPEEYTINHKTYKRDNYTISLIKKIRGYKCQICGNSILKEDGDNYIEAAHIIPKHEKGREKPENIIILCPNHHKEFDLGNRQIISHTHKQIVFLLNENKHKIKLSIK
jgi:5-methylcytosine-specific restriction endonuclease McrA